MEDTAKYTSILRVWYLNTILLGIFARHTVCCPSGSTRQHLEVLFLILGWRNTNHPFSALQREKFFHSTGKTTFPAKGFGIWRSSLTLTCPSWLPGDSTSVHQPWQVFHFLGVTHLFHILGVSFPVHLIVHLGFWIIFTRLARIWLRLKSISVLNLFSFYHFWILSGSRSV